ncbi:MAG: FkbM family methyltransferase [Flavobacteriales bacterium]|nr:FkbM family methyltransferase [Flavobacteriales bacterium]
MKSYAYHEDLGLRTRLLNALRGLFRHQPFEGWLQRRAQGRSLDSVWVKLVPPEYTYAPGSWRKVERHGLRWRLDLGNINDHALFFDPAYAADDVLFGLVGPNSRVVDIGGNIGSYALRFAKKATAGNVVTFEPHPNTFAKLQANLALNKLANLRAINVGIGAEEATHRLHEVVASNSGMNRIITTAAVDPTMPYVEVKVLPLSKALSGAGLEKVDLLKIDVEGFEDAVLVGSADVILRDKPILFIELIDGNLKENGASARQLVDRVVAWGYKVTEAVSGRSIADDDPLAGCAMDVVCRPR